MTLGRRRLVAVLAAIAAFATAILAAVSLAPYALGFLYGCFPPKGSCGDGVGWAMVISAPIMIPVTLIIATLLGRFAYRAVMRVRISN